MEFKKPSMRISDVFAGFFIALAFLLLLVIIHVLSINSEYETQTVLQGVFIVLLWVYIFVITLAAVGLFAQAFLYFSWLVTTPKWYKERIKTQQKQNVR